MIEKEENKSDSLVAKYGSKLVEIYQKFMDESVKTTQLRFLRNSENLKTLPRLSFDQNKEIQEKGNIDVI